MVSIPWHLGSISLSFVGHGTMNHRGGFDLGRVDTQTLAKRSIMAQDFLTRGE